jgi:endogenous inhibitor of DNA gyrase (YacG/DUF329 family)
MKKFNCVRCGKEGVHYHSQSKGLYCSVQCQQWLIIEKKMIAGNCNYSHGIRRWCYGNLPQVCCMCGTGSEWNGKPLRLQVDHKDGNTKNNKRENLRMICPNCHTQTDNWGVNNASKEGVEKMKEAGIKSSQKRYFMGC